jgi:hypothetical protein
MGEGGGRKYGLLQDLLLLVVSVGILPSGHNILTDFGSHLDFHDILLHEKCHCKLTNSDRSG